MECGFSSNLNPETQEMQVCTMSINISQITRTAIEGQLLWIQVNQMSEDAVLLVKELSDTQASLFLSPIESTKILYKLYNTKSTC